MADAAWRKHWRRKVETTWRLVDGHLAVVVSKTLDGRWLLDCPMVGIKRVHLDVGDERAAKVAAQGRVESQLREMLAVAEAWPKDRPA